MSQAMLELLREHPEHLDDLSHDALGRLLAAVGEEPRDQKQQRRAQVEAMIAPGADALPSSPQLAEPRRVRIEGPVTTRSERARETPGELLHAVIYDRSDAISYERYNDYLERAFCGQEDVSVRAPSVYLGVDAYQQLKAATEAFLMCEAGTFPTGDPKGSVIRSRLEHRGVTDLNELYREYREDYLKVLRGDLRTLPYYERIIDALGELPLKGVVPEDGCYGIVRSRVSPPCLLELVWSYWLEEGMLMQTMNAISLRFQNKRSGGRNPLAHLEIDPLRPLNNLIWGWIQDEPQRLSLVRRAYEYDHHYGLRLRGKAVPELEPADSRTQFLEAFHNLLYLATVFFKEEDDKNINADGFPVLNALKELHLVLAHGAHNQAGDLPWQARSEMLIVQWLLARPEMREFLGGRAMVPYPEPWMGRVDTMSALQGWGGGGVTPFRDLALYGERLLLSVRYQDWVDEVEGDEATNWAKFWRSEIQAYVHAYRSVTGVDLSADPIHQEQLKVRFMQPSTLLAGRNGGVPSRPAPTGDGAWR
jgi:hypothetical protein